MQGSANIDNFLNLAQSGNLICSSGKHNKFKSDIEFLDKTNSVKTLVYYVAPAGPSSRCGGGACSNSDNGSGTLWDDLNLVFKDVINQLFTL